MCFSGNGRLQALYRIIADGMATNLVLRRAYLLQIAVVLSGERIRARAVRLVYSGSVDARAARICRLLHCASVGVGVGVGRGLAARVSLARVLRVRALSCDRQCAGAASPGAGARRAAERHVARGPLHVQAPEGQRTVRLLDLLRRPLEGAQAHHESIRGTSTALLFSW